MKACLSRGTARKLSQAWLRGLTRGSNHTEEDGVYINKSQIRYAAADLKKRCNIRLTQADGQVDLKIDSCTPYSIELTGLLSHNLLPPRARDVPHAALWVMTGLTTNRYSFIPLLRGILSQMGLCTNRQEKRNTGNVHQKWYETCTRAHSQHHLHIFQYSESCTDISYFVLWVEQLLDVIPITNRRPYYVKSWWQHILSDWVISSLQESFVQGFSFSFILSSNVLLSHLKKVTNLAKSPSNLKWATLHMTNGESNI